MAQLVNANANDLVTGGDKFRVIWEFYFAAWLPDWFYDSAPSLADKIREWLPSIGCIAVSLPNAQPGDKIILFDIRLAQSYNTGANNIGTLVARLDTVPGALRVQKLIKLGSETSAETAQAQAQDWQQAEEQAVHNSVLDSLGDVASGAIKSALVIGALLLLAYAAFLKRQ